MNVIKRFLLVFFITLSLSAIAFPVSAQEVEAPDCSRVAASQTRYDVEAERFIQRTHDSHHNSNLRFLKGRDIKENQIFTKIDRDEVSMNRDFDRVRGRIKTEEQAAAVDEYINAVVDAHVTRRDKIIEAVVAYRDATDQIIIDRWLRLEGAYFQHRDDVSAMGAQALADCEAGNGSPIDINRNLGAEVRNRKLQLREELKTLKEFDPVLRELRVQRDTTVRDSNKEFLQTRTDLRRNLEQII